jgi:hypothetical protein
MEYGEMGGGVLELQGVARSGADCSVTGLEPLERNEGEPALGGREALCSLGAELGDLL